MSVLHLNHIAGEIDKNIKGLIDVSDLNQITDKTNIILSRSFALYTLKCVTDKNYDELKHSITDGFNDNGIDALYIDKSSNTFYIVQVKWINSASGGPDKGDILKFLQGIKDLITFKFNLFNDKIISRTHEIKTALLDSNIKLKAVLGFTGTHIADDLVVLINNTFNELNDADEVIFFEAFNLKEAHRCLVLGLGGSPINANFDFHQWGKNDEPVKSIYGQVNCLKFVDLFKENKLRLFSSNIRGFMGEGDINNQIVNSIIKDPEHFFYLNNGITILAKKVHKAPYGGNDRNMGHFQCDDITIVNGAQTVGSIYEAYKRNREPVEKANVFVRVISLENCPNNFDKRLTIATNTQNKIEKKDFVSLEEEQHRLKVELLLDRINYTFKRDESSVVPDERNYDLEEATVALACFQQDEDFSTLAKREISRLWEDTKSQPYIVLFNKSLQGIRLVKTVNIFRYIEKRLKDSIVLGNEHDLMILTHGNYFISHLIFQDVDKDILFNPNKKMSSEFFIHLDELIEKYKKHTISTFQKSFPSKFPPTVFKNASSVRLLKGNIYSEVNKVLPGQTLKLFP